MLDKINIVCYYYGMSIIKFPKYGDPKYRELSIKRNKEILRLRKEEVLSLQHIADIYGISRQRVNQIIGSNSLSFKVGKNTKYRLEHPRQPRKTMTERFWEKVDIKNDSECWEWKNGKYLNGYGGFNSNNKHEYAHRIAWELTYGAIPENMCVCHHCDNPSCCNPKHLFIGTMADNMHDRDRKGRGRPHGKYTTIHSEK
jgi:predicted DNA-binding protein YlxM (UPF0122 family)